MAKRIITARAFSPRTWQTEAMMVVQEIIASGKKKDCLIVGTPGSGKTKLGLMIAHDLLKRNLADRVEIITYTEQLKRQWALESADFAGIDIDPDFTNSQGMEANDYYGISITYALLGQDKKGVHAQNTFNKRTFVILDEIHHAGESLSWGDALQNSFEGAVFRLALSGTAFRSDDNKIPFITYDENRMSVADYTYSYERAIAENVCRPVYFTSYDGQMNWKVGELEFTHSFKDHLEKDQVSKRLKTALDPKGNWVRDVILAADKKLSEVRETHHDAAGLITAATQQHAREIAKIVHKITGENPPVVISEETDSSNKIGKFKNSTERWMVSVKMVSEGIDVPRFRVGAYLTNIKTEMYFRQFTGRFVRVLEHLQYQDAFIFIPQDKDIVMLAETIQEEREHALDQCKPNAGGAGGTDLFGNDYTPALEGKFVPLGSEATDNRIIQSIVELSSGAKHSIDTRKPTDQEPVFVQKEIIRNRLNNLAKKVALRRRNGSNTKPEWDYAHKAYLSNVQGAKKMDIETIDELKKREEFYQNLLRN